MLFINLNTYTHTRRPHEKVALLSTHEGSEIKFTRFIMMTMEFYFRSYASRHGAIKCEILDILYIKVLHPVQKRPTGILGLYTQHVAPGHL